MSVIELVRVVRSGFHESTHLGAVVITGPDGEVLEARGPVDRPVFPRSSNKPFQALAMLAAGAPLAGPDLALASASHSGEAIHTERALAILARAGLTEDDLGCPVALPMYEPARDEVIRAGGTPRRIYMNCSGKHSGMLAACVAAGWDTDSYLSPDHPLQLGVAEQVRALSGEEPVATGIDGCGAPLFAISLTGLARAFGRLTTAAPGTPERAVADAMRAFPELVAGSGRDDTLMMQAIPGLLMKAGAEGVHAAALDDGHAVALKIADGHERARTPVLVAALRYLGVENPVLDRFERGVVLGGGAPVGSVEVVPGLF